MLKRISEAHEDSPSHYELSCPLLSKISEAYHYTHAAHTRRPLAHGFKQIDCELPLLCPATAHPLICSCKPALSYVSLQDAMLRMPWNLACALPLVPATHTLLGLLAAQLAKHQSSAPMPLCRQAWSSPAGWVSQREWYPGAGVQGEALASCSTITASICCMTALCHMPFQSSESALCHGDIAQDFRQ